jgi:hypothetical protein
MGQGPESFGVAWWVADRPVANWWRCEWAAPRSWPNRRRSPPMTAASRRCFPRNFKLRTAMGLLQRSNCALSSEAEENQTTGVRTGHRACLPSELPCSARHPALCGDEPLDAPSRRAWPARLRAACHAGRGGPNLLVVGRAAPCAGTGPTPRAAVVRSSSRCGSAGKGRCRCRSDPTAEATDPG